MRPFPVAARSKA